VLHHSSVRPIISDSCLSVCLSVCDVGVLWSNGWMYQDDTFRASRSRPRPHCVRWGPSSCKRVTAPNFRPMSVVVKRLHGSRCHLVRGRPRPRRHCVRWDLAPSKTGSTATPHFYSMYCRQTALWIKMPLGAEVRLGPGHIVLDGDPAHPLPPQKGGGAQQPQFLPTSVVAKQLDG